MRLFVGGADQSLGALGGGFGERLGHGLGSLLADGSLLDLELRREVLLGLVLERIGDVGDCGFHGSVGGCQLFCENRLRGCLGVGELSLELIGELSLTRVEGGGGGFGGSLQRGILLRGALRAHRLLEAGRLLFEFGGGAFAHLEPRGGHLGAEGRLELGERGVLFLLGLSLGPRDLSLRGIVRGGLSLGDEVVRGVLGGGGRFVQFSRKFSLERVNLRSHGSLGGGDGGRDGVGVFLGGGGESELLVAPRGGAEGIGGGGGFSGVASGALFANRALRRRELLLRGDGGLLQLERARRGGFLDELRALALQRGVRLGGEGFQRLLLLTRELSLEFLHRRGLISGGRLGELTSLGLHRGGVCRLQV